MSRFFQLIILAIGLISTTLNAGSITVKWSGGAPFSVDFADSDSPKILKKRIEQETGVEVDRQQLFLGEFEWGAEKRKAEAVLVPFHLEGDLTTFKASVKKLSHHRVYASQLTKKERKGIKYIVTNLADKGATLKGLTQLLQIKSKLEKTGDEIDHVHPLRFLEAAFTDEKMKVGIRNIKKQGGWVGDDFFDGLFSSLTEESKKSNMTDPMIYDFAGIVGIDSALIIQDIRERKWKQLIETLIKEIPRDPNHRRHDM
jgi:hypothetical protein